MHVSRIKLSTEFFLDIQILNIQILRLGCCLPPLNKYSGYVSAHGLHSAEFSPMAQRANYATGL